MIIWSSCFYKTSECLSPNCNSSDTLLCLILGKSAMINGNFHNSKEEVNYDKRYAAKTRGRFMRRYVQGKQMQ